MADFVIGRPSNLFQQSVVQDDSRAREFHFFAQDDFKISRRLTLNMGLRNELNVPWVQSQDWTATIRPAVPCSISGTLDCAHSQKFPTAPPGLVYPGDPGVPRSLIQTDKHNLSPRLGLAWDPFGTGRTSIRAAYGIFYTYQGAIFQGTVNQIEPFLVPISLPAPPSFSNPYAGRVDPFPYTLNPQNPLFAYPMQAYTMEPDFRTPYVQQMNVNIQHQFGTDLFIQAGYVGRLGRKLTATREKNTAVYSLGATAANVQSRRPFFPQYYSAISQISSDTNSSYNSLQMNVEKKFFRSYTVQLAYTFSKSIDEQSNGNVDGGGAQDPKGRYHSCAATDSCPGFSATGSWRAPRAS
jgi:hypothetical protein